MEKHRYISATLLAQALMQAILCFAWIAFTLQWHKKEWQYLTFALIAATAPSSMGTLSAALLIPPATSSAISLLPYVAVSPVYQYYRDNALRAFSYMAVRTAALFLSFVCALTNREESHGTGKRDKNELKIWTIVGFVSLGVAYLMEAIIAFEVVNQRESVEQRNPVQRFFNAIINPVTVANLGAAICCAFFIVSVVLHKLGDHPNLAREILGYAAATCSAILALYYLTCIRQSRSASAPQQPAYGATTVVPVIGPTGTGATGAQRFVSGTV